jgi:hypothetical protein
MAARESASGPCTNTDLADLLVKLKAKEMGRAA